MDYLVARRAGFLGQKDLATGSQVEIDRVFQGETYRLTVL